MAVMGAATDDAVTAEITALKKALELEKAAHAETKAELEWTLVEVVPPEDEQQADSTVHKPAKPSVSLAERHAQMETEHRLLRAQLGLCAR